MREQVSKDKSSLEDYGYKPYRATKKKLNLNDLLKRIEIQKKKDKKLNILIFCGAILAVVIFIYLYSL